MLWYPRAPKTLEPLQFVSHSSETLVDFPTTGTSQSLPAFGTMFQLSVGGGLKLKPPTRISTWDCFPSCQLTDESCVKSAGWKRQLQIWLFLPQQRRACISILLYLLALTRIFVVSMLQFCPFIVGFCYHIWFKRPTNPPATTPNPRYIPYSLKHGWVQREARACLKSRDSLTHPKEVTRSILWILPQINVKHAYDQHQLNASRRTILPERGKLMIRARRSQASVLYHETRTSAGLRRDSGNGHVIFIEEICCRLRQRHAKFLEIFR